MSKTSIFPRVAGDIYCEFDLLMRSKGKTRVVHMYFARDDHENHEKLKINVQIEKTLAVKNEL